MVAQESQNITTEGGTLQSMESLSNGSDFGDMELHTSVNWAHHLTPKEGITKGRFLSLVH